MMFALGVSLIPSQLPRAQIAAFFEAFGRLPQRVIMRMERPEGIRVPENILLRKFLPQQAILAHPKVTLYFGHGGVNGLMEAIYYRCLCRVFLMRFQSFPHNKFQEGDHCDAGVGRRRGQREEVDGEGRRGSGVQG